MTDRVAECIYPDNISYRGCMLHYEKNPAGAIKSLQQKERTTDREHHAEKSQIQTANREFLKNGEGLN